MPRTPKPPRPCSVSGCDHKHYAKGLCAAHYERLRRHGTTDGEMRQYGHDGCSVEGCDGAHMSRGYCQKHYQRWRKHGDPSVVVVPARERTGKPWPNRDGYLYVYVGKEHPWSNTAGAILQHRLVMAEHLGRELLREEEPHHRNGDRTDNRLSNLELWSSSQPAGQRVEDKIAWAKELLALYEPEALASC